MARRVLGSIFRWWLRGRSRQFPFDAASVTLIFAPHQDDETLGCGGLIPLLIEAGHQVRITYITDGSGSHPDDPTVAGRRRAEALAATTQLGVSPEHLEFLDARDGSLAWLNEQEAMRIVAQISSTLNRVQPTLVLLPCRADGSSEHDAAFTLFDRALTATGRHPRVLEFPIWSWWNPLLLRRPLRSSRRIWRASFPGHAAKKRHALSAYVTQVKPAGAGQGPVLTPAFLSFFAAAEEFFFEH